MWHLCMCLSLNIPDNISFEKAKQIIFHGKIRRITFNEVIWKKHLNNSTPQLTTLFAPSIFFSQCKVPSKCVEPKCLRFFINRISVGKIFIFGAIFFIAFFSGHFSPLSFEISNCTLLIVAYALNTPNFNVFSEFTKFTLVSK